MIEQQVSTGRELLQTVRQLEERFSLAPSLRLLEAMMALTREAVECLGEAQDAQHLHALHRMQAFLARADVIQLLDGAKTASSVGGQQQATVTTLVESLGKSAGMEQEGCGGGSSTCEARQLPVVTGEGFSSAVKSSSTSAADRRRDREDEGEREDLRLEKELYDLIGILDEELNTLMV